MRSLPHGYPVLCGASRPERGNERKIPLHVANRQFPAITPGLQPRHRGRSAQHLDAGQRHGIDDRPAAEPRADHVVVAAIKPVGRRRLHLEPRRRGPHVVAQRVDEPLPEQPGADRLDLRHGENRRHEQARDKRDHERPAIDQATDAARLPKHLAPLGRDAGERRGRQAAAHEVEQRPEVLPSVAGRTVERCRECVVVAGPDEPQE